MLNLHHLRIFYAVAKRMSYTKAAEDLFITQPAVTNQIKAFEEQLGLHLFEVKSGKIRLTQEGKTLYQRAQQLFDVETDIEKIVSDLKGSKVGTISLGTSRTYSHTLLPMLISRFHEFYPNIIVKVDEAGSLEIVDRLLDFQNELAICVKTADNPKICFIPFFTEELVVVMPIGHRLNKRKFVTLPDLAAERIVLRGKGSASRQILDRLFEAAYIAPHILTEANNTELIKGMVRRGEGISFLSRIAVAKEAAEGKLHIASLQENGVPLNISIAFLKDRTLSPAAMVFLDFLKGLTPPDKPMGSASELIKKLLDSTAKHS